MKSELLAAFDALAPFAEVSVKICSLASTGGLDAATDLRVVCTRVGLSQAKAGEVERALTAGVAPGVFSRVSSLTWQVANTRLVGEITPLLLGAHLYLSRVHRDEDVVDVVLTKPPAPSRMSLQLESMLAGSWGLRDTQQLLPAIAESAKQSFTVMSPYLDEVGASIVLNLFERAYVQERYLVLRVGPDGKSPAGLLDIREELDRLDVKVLNFRIERVDGGGNETFHAKVVLADEAAAYVGSSNMHKWSFEYSLELGIYVRGRAAARIADILRAVRSVSSPMP